MKVNKLIIGLIVCFSAMTLAAQSDSIMSFSLIEAQNYAIENFFMSKNAALNVESARKKIWETTAIGLPQLNAGANYAYLPVIPTLDFGGMVIEGGVEHNITYNLSLTQLIFSGEYIVGLQASQTYMKLSEEAYVKTKIEIKQLLANTYYTVLVLETNKKLLSETTENLRRIYEETTKTADQGLLDKTDADQIGINVKRTENQLFSVERQLEFMQKMLKYQLGLTESVAIELTDSLKSLVNNDLLIQPTLYIFNLDSHIDYKLLDTQEKLNLLSLKREKSLYLPSLAGFYQYSNMTNPGDFNLNPEHIVGISLNVPIFASGSKGAKVSQAKIALMQAQNTKSQESTRLIMEAQQASFDYSSALERFNNEKENFDLSKRILESYTQKFKLGMVSSMDLTLTNNQYLQAQLTYSGAILELLNSKVKMDKAYSKL